MSKNWLTGELQKEERAKQAAHSITALQVLTKVRVWHLGLIVFTVNIGMYTLSFWLPQMVKSFSSGYSNQSVGWMVMIPHVAGLIGMVLISRSSDRKMERRLHAAIPATLQARRWSAWCNAFGGVDDRAASDCSSGDVQRVWTYPLAAERVFVRICGGIGACLGEYDFEHSGICGAVHYGMDQPKNRESAARIISCRDFSVCGGRPCSGAAEESEE